MISLSEHEKTMQLIFRLSLQYFMMALVAEESLSNALTFGFEGTGLINRIDSLITTLPANKQAEVKAQAKEILF